MRLITTLTALLCLRVLSSPAMAEGSGVFLVDAGKDTLVFQFSEEASGFGKLLALPIHTEAPADKGGVTVWEGEIPAGRKVSIPRFIGSRDRLYERFLWREAKGDSEPQYVTEFRGCGREVGDNPIRSGGKKGLACVQDLAEAGTLGVRHVAINIRLADLIDWQDAEPPHFQMVDGRRIGIRAGGIRRLDRELAEAARLGMAVTGVFYNAFPRSGTDSNPLIHPQTDRHAAPNSIGAFNTRTAEGVLHLRAAFEFLVERYVAKNLLHALVVGNEVQSHWFWHNQGEAEPGEVIRDYHAALRIADLATRSRHADFPVYISMDHHWAGQITPTQPGHSMTGRAFFEGIALAAKKGGDFPWQVAFHPYPGNLFRPEFWDDSHAPLRPDAAKITFKNLEVLDHVLHQPEFLYRGKPRRIALSEQGFHFDARREGGELLQAAAYAVAFKKVAAMPLIDAFHYHRHVDARGEGGLLLGLRGEGGARKLYEVFRSAGTSGEDEAFAFALPIAGLRDWSGLVSEVDPVTVLIDLIPSLGAAGSTGGLPLEIRRAPDGRKTIYQHPITGAPSLAAMRILIPRADVGNQISLDVTPWMQAEGGKVRFSLAIDGREVIAETLSGPAEAPQRIDLATWAGREVELAFKVDPLGASTHDWAHWIAPEIVHRPAATAAK